MTEILKDFDETCSSIFDIVKKKPLPQFPSFPPKILQKLNKLENEHTVWTIDVVQMETCQ